MLDHHGEKKFPGQPMMKATVAGAPRFKFMEILGQDQLKAYAAKPRADLEDQLERLLKKEQDAADQALQQQHPDEHAIKHILKCKDIKDQIRKCGQASSKGTKSKSASKTSKQQLSAGEHDSNKLKSLARNSGPVGEKIKSANAATAKPP